MKQTLWKETATRAAMEQLALLMWPQSRTPARLVSTGPPKSNCRASRPASIKAAFFTGQLQQIVTFATNPRTNAAAHFAHL